MTFLFTFTVFVLFVNKSVHKRFIKVDKQDNWLRKVCKEAKNFAVIGGTGPEAA